MGVTHDLVQCLPPTLYEKAQKKEINRNGNLYYFLMQLGTFSLISRSKQQPPPHIMPNWLHINATIASLPAR